MLIKLRLTREFEGDEIGDLLVAVDSIESVKCYDSSGMPGSRITLKPVVSGFLGDDDRIYRTQSEHIVAESVEQIARLMGDYVKQAE